MDGLWEVNASAAVKSSLPANAKTDFGCVSAIVAEMSRESVIAIDDFDCVKAIEAVYDGKSDNGVADIDVRVSIHTPVIPEKGQSFRLFQH